MGKHRDRIGKKYSHCGWIEHTLRRRSCASFVPAPIRWLSSTRWVGRLSPEDYGDSLATRTGHDILSTRTIRQGEGMFECQTRGKGDQGEVRRRNIRIAINNGVPIYEANVDPCLLTDRAETNARSSSSGVGPVDGFVRCTGIGIHPAITCGSESTVLVEIHIESRKRIL